MKRYFRICALDFLFLVAIFVVSFIYEVTFSDDSIAWALHHSWNTAFSPYGFIVYYSFIFIYLWVFNIAFFIPKIKNHITLIVIMQAILPCIMSYDSIVGIFFFSSLLYMCYKIFVLRLWNKPEKNTLKANIKRYLDICTLDILFYVVVFGSFILFLTLFKSYSQDDLFDQLIVWFAIFHLCVLNISFFIPKLKDNFKVLMFLQIIVAVVAYYSFQTNEFIYTLGNGLEMYKLGNSSFFEILKYYIISNINYFIINF